ncbi:dihydrofolate reductase family protein [Microvirga puerhi]|uniref:Dihydrofolate reductase family protein n=1 Tax=Microvirga puerhi TaxID=2876078 RepID=A0ABS7VSI1_9HYPH|nr:dihydrofolate reductase family protein [Microvirga puerhi]MBZ6078500.1 dihydrofolate reductase family protein [Microvirga puerhi]
MAKLVLSMFTSLDGYIEGPNGEFAPPAWSGDIEEHWSGYALQRAGHLLYGRKNFLFNKDFWSAAETDPKSPAAGIAYAGIMNRLPKTVFSTTLRGDPGWNATLVADDVAGAIERLKTAIQGDLYLFGGAGIANTVMTFDLVDEYRLMVTPTLLGDGKRLFDDGRPRRSLELIESKQLDTGAIILRYRPNHTT